MIIIIAAVGKNLELGYKNDLIWHLKGDMKFFKDHTINHSVVMGYNTFVSLPKLLPNRKHIVLTHKPKEMFPNEVEVFNTKEELLEYIKNEDDVYIIGGASIYKEFLEDSDKLLLTEIADESKCDVYFPKFNKDKYDIKVLSINEEDNIKYKHKEYKKKNY